MDRRPVEREDLLRWRAAGDPQASPDGARCVFTLQHIDAEKNRYRTALWLTAPGMAARALTGSSSNASSPRWSPDGRAIAFVSDRDEPGSQIYLLPTDGGEAVKLTSLPPGSIQAVSWSPDGRQIAFLYRATPDERLKVAEEARKEKGLSPPVRVHTRLAYRSDGAGYHDGSRWRVYVADAAVGSARPLTPDDHDFGGLCWSPDGTSIVASANLRDDADLTGMLDDLWRVPLTPGAPERIPAPPGPKYAVSVSPDGALIAWVGHTDTEDTWGCRNERVLVIPCAGAEQARDLTGALDVCVGYQTLGDLHSVGAGMVLQWAPSSDRIFFPVSAFGDTRLCSLPLADGPVTWHTGAGLELGDYSLAPGPGIAYALLGSATTGHDVWRLRLDDDAQPQQLSSVNQEFLAEVEFRMPEPITAEASDGAPVPGWLIRATVCAPGPAILYIHGGPALQYGGQSSPFHEIQWLAAQGYTVIFGNPRGSKGYGEAHTSACTGDWGNLDWLDVQALADYAAALPEVDPERMAIMGGSYGGYMTAWAVGHTQRFRCAIADRLVANLQSMSGTCDFPWKPNGFFRGNPWDDPADLLRVSPLSFAGRIETPLLIIHSDGDLRCPIEQAEQLFAALRWRRKEVELVRYPATTSHGMSRNGPPDMRLDRLSRNLSWLDRWLKV